MRRLYKLVVTVAFAFLFSCSSNSDHKADHPPARILIVGNSIVRHPPAPGLEWFGDWGMAASAPDKDLVYQYTAKVMAEYDAVVESQNITFWENDFSYDLDLYTNLGAHQYDLVIVRLGENVLDTASYAQALKEMADHFRADGGKVIITGLVWENEAKELIHQQVAYENQYRFVPLDQFRSDSQKYSWGLYNNGAVAAHPSDLGMAYMSDVLYEATVEMLGAD